MTSDNNSALSSPDTNTTRITMDLSNDDSFSVMTVDDDPDPDYYYDEDDNRTIIPLAKKKKKSTKSKANKSVKKSPGSTKKSLKSLGVEKIRNKSTLSNQSSTFVSPRKSTYERILTMPDSTNRIGLSIPRYNQSTLHSMTEISSPDDSSSNPSHSSQYVNDNGHL